MTLLEKQKLFPQLLEKLFTFMRTQGHEWVIGEVWRSDETALAYAKAKIGVANSLHRLKLAADLVLFVGDSRLTDSADYKEAGQYWKSLSKPPGFVCRWGGDFMTYYKGKLVPKPDGGHFSIEHEGVK